MDGVLTVASLATLATTVDLEWYSDSRLLVAIVILKSPNYLLLAPNNSPNSTLMKRKYYRYLSCSTRRTTISISEYGFGPAGSGQGLQGLSTAESTIVSIRPRQS